MSTAANRYLVVQPSDLVNTPSAIYHEHSKVSEFRVRFGEPDPRRTEEMLAMYHSLNAHSRSFDHLPRIPLPRTAWNALGTPLGQVLEERRTNRNFAKQPLSLEQLGQLLLLGAGTNGELEYAPNQTRHLRTYPSGGALYPIDLYVVALDVSGLEAGVYFFDPDRSSLSLIQRGDTRKSFFAAFIDGPMVDDASVLLLQVGVFQRSRIKYEERAYRFVLLEAGHMAQNLVLVANSCGLSAVPNGAFFDRRVDDLLDLDGVEESILYTLIVGIPQRT